MRPHDLLPAKHALHLVALLSLVVALVGTYWDDAWHTDVGRDAFFSPPHILLYAGIGIAGLTVGARALGSWRDARSIRGVLRQRATTLSLVGAATTLASAPVDEAWHQLYGRDAVAWSPPHLMGLVGVLLLAGGIHLDLRDARNRLGRWTRHLAAAAILAILMALVFEYDSDVPQFDEMWYLPVMTLALGLAFALTSDAGRWSATRAAAIYTGLMLLTIAFLAILDHSRPVVPLVVLPALADDLARRKRAPLPVRAALLATVVFLAYWPYLHALSGVRPDALDTLLGLPLAILLAALALAGATWRPRARHAGAALLVLGLLLVPLAGAHDPGQGAPVHPVRLAAERVDGLWRVSAEVQAEGCPALAPDRIEARRAGRVLTSALDATGPCRYEGALDVEPRGRSFVYVQLHDEEGPLEAWLPVHPEEGDRFQKETTLYRPPAPRPSATQTAAAIVLYAGELALVALLLRERRRAEAGS